MKQRSNNFAVGMSAILFSALFLATILFLNPMDRRKTQTIEVQFKHSDGLAPVKYGSPVLLSGAVQVGTVTGLWTETLTVTDATGMKSRQLVIIVRAEIDANVELYGDCQITTDQPAVGGVASVVILDVGTIGTEMPVSRHIVGKPPQSLAATIGTLSRRLLGPDGFVEKLDRMIDGNVEGSVMYKVLRSLSDINDVTHRLSMEVSAAEQQSLMAKLHVVMDGISGVATALREELGTAKDSGLIAKVHAAMDRLNESLSEIRGLLGDTRPGLTRTVDHVERISGRLNDEIIVSLRAEVDRDDPNSMLGKLHVLMNRVNASMADVQEVAASGRAIALHSKPALERTIANLKEMSDELRLAGSEIRLAPWRLLYTPTEKEKERMSVFEAARTFSEAATYLDDAAARLEATAAFPSGGSPEQQQEVANVRQALKEAFERFQRAEAYLWEKLK